MQTNLIRRNQGDNIWAGYLCHRTYHNADGNLFPGGAKYVVFRDGWLVGAYDTLTEGDKGYLSGWQLETRLSDYMGIDTRLRGG